LPLFLVFHRKSSVVPSNGRQSSLSSNTGGGGRVADPRPIGDKAFLNSCIRQLVEYLSYHNYDNPISLKILSKPTNKDYYNICLFLFKQIDPNYAYTGKIEDEIVGMFKYLGYPYPISKANIVAVGSPHAWPALLAALIWLVELLSYDNVIQSQETEGILNNEALVSPPSAAGIASSSGGPLNTPSSTGDDVNSEKAFHKYVGKAYGYFITGNDNQQLALHNAFLSSYENKNILIRDKIESIEKRNIALSNEIEDLKQKTASLPQIDSRRKELQKEFAGLSSLVEEKKKNLSKLTSLKDEKVKELNKAKDLFSSITRDISMLKETISKQEISPEDIINMINERERLEEAQRSASEHRQGLQRKIWELEMTLRDKVASLEDTVKAYHSIAEDLKMIPSTARNARGENLMIEIDIRAKRREGLLKTPIKSFILPILQDVRKELYEMTLDLKSELIAEKETLSELEEKKTEFQQAIESFESKSKRIEAIYKREKESLDSMNELHCKEMDLMESRLLQLTDTATEEAKITSSTRRIAEANSLRSARKEEYLRTKSHLLEAIMEVISLCASHREMISNKFESFKTSMQKKLELVGEMTNDESAFMQYAKVRKIIILCYSFRFFLFSFKGCS
jgi:kinetochore protein NDC80